jgi:hypothetical protein
MGVDQISRHDHSTDADGGTDIAPESVEVETASLGDDGDTDGDVDIFSPLNMRGGYISGVGGPDAATGGAVRMANGTGIVGRNAADDDDIVIVSLSGGDAVGVGDRNLIVYSNGNTSLQGNKLVNVGSRNSSISGAINLGNGKSVSARNADDDGDVALMRLSGGDNLEIGGNQLNLFRGGAISAQGNIIVNIGGTADANSGAVRLANTASIAWRNSDDTDDHELYLAGGDGLVYKRGNTRTFTIRGSGDISLAGNRIFDVGDGTGAKSGGIRMGNNTDIKARNAASDGDIRAIGVTGSDQVVVGGDNASALALDAGDGVVRLPNGGINVIDSNITVKSETGNRRISFTAAGVGNVLAVGGTDSGERGFIYNPVDSTTTLNFYNSNSAGGERVEVGSTPFLCTNASRFRVPDKDSDPADANDGDIWYRRDLNEYRGVEGGTTVSFDTTPV